MYVNHPFEGFLLKSTTVLLSWLTFKLCLSVLECVKLNIFELQNGLNDLLNALSASYNQQSK